MTTQADELRTAARKIRDLAAAVEVNNHPDLPWHVEECSNDERGDCPCIVAQGRYSHHGGPPTPLFYVADAETPECAAYIAAMGPNVGAALADWLDWEAETVSRTTWASINISLDRALAVARAINGCQR